MFDADVRVGILIDVSYSCVPQNRNSIMTFALKYFLDKSTTLQQIEQKFCQPGHSSIQEVDNIHSFKIADKALAISLPPRPAMSSDQIALYAFLVVDKWAVKLNTLSLRLL
jgi:hypothetical protein